MIEDREVLDQLRDEPELLALADALASTQPKPRGKGRRIVVVTGAVLATAAALALFVAVRGGETSITETALAAVGEAPVIHAVLEFPVRSPEGAERIDLTSGRRIPVIQTEEVWADPEREVSRFVSRVNGQVFSDALVTSSKIFTQAGSVPRAGSPVRPVIVGFVTGYRDALARGEAKIVGDDVVEGRDVTWIEFDSGGAEQAERVAVDRENGRPLFVQWITRGRPQGPRIKIVSAEAQARAESRLLRPRVTEPRVQLIELKALSAAEARSALPHPAVWAGRNSASLRLDRIMLLRYDLAYAPGGGAPVSVPGLKIVYMDASNGGSVEVVESSSPHILEWLGIVPPRGAADVFQGAARLQKGDLFVKVQATNNQQALAVARALTPMPGR